MPYVTVPKDLTKVKTKVLFNLTKRQLICFSIGIAIGVGFYLGGILCACIVLFTLPLLVNAERKKEQPLSYTRLYAEVQHIGDVDRLQEDLRAMSIGFEEFNVCPPHSGTPGHIGIGMSIHEDGCKEAARKLRTLDYIVYAVTAN